MGLMVTRRDVVRHSLRRPGATIASKGRFFSATVNSEILVGRAHERLFRTLNRQALDSTIRGH
jgi:hypothetical protein